MTLKLQHLLKTTIFFSLTFFSCMIWAEIEQEQAIHAPVNALHTSLLSIMENADTKSFQERYDVMKDVVVKHFNSPLIAKVILSRHWKTLNEQSQADFIALFNRLTVSTYVDRFDSFNGETFNNLSIEQMKKNRFMVKTEYVRTNDTPVSFNYIVQSDNEQWRIISVIANGINDLSLKRADYSAVMKNQGFDVLIANLKEKISNLQPK
jgi:phospholipid transport system substrate-binding protein